MHYDGNQIMKAFKIYTKLAAVGTVHKEEARSYLVDYGIKGLVDQFAEEVSGTIFIAGDFVYMIPKTMASPFHISNESLKKEYLPSKAVNSDIYMMYVAIIVLFGEFYDSYQTTNPTRDFISLNDWLDSVNERIFSLKEHGSEKLEEMEKKYEYNWTSIVERWDPLDDIRVGVKSQDARTESRVSFLNITKVFLEKQDLIKDIGNDELELTEKAKTIIQRYYMDYEYNKEILEFMYAMGQGEE